MEKEDIEKLLASHDNIMFIMPEDEKYGEFNRNIKFIVREKEYRIEYWKNICNLFIGEVQVPFKFIKISGTWPNGFKYNIQLIGPDGNNVAILPLEEYL